METFSALLALCAGNSPVTGEFPSQWPVTRSFDVFFDLCQITWLPARRASRPLRQAPVEYNFVNTSWMICPVMYSSSGNKITTTAMKTSLYWFTQRTSVLWPIDNAELWSSQRQFSIGNAVYIKCRLYKIIRHQRYAIHNINRKQVWKTKHLRRPSMNAY